MRIVLLISAVSQFSIYEVETFLSYFVMEIPFCMFSERGFSTVRLSLRKKCPYFEFFWPYSVRMRENKDQKNSEYGHFLHSVSNH